ncbi:terminase [Siphonobacter sp.]|uniref:terminase n=1 Tax=Siphonobacter sp. TaxID=1869184 RepID=UPI003B3BE2D1
MAAPLNNNYAEGQGRPTAYKPDYDDQAYRLCLLGFTDEQLASYFEVTGRTINNWKAEHPSFFQSLKRGKLIADARVAESLFERAIGYSHPDLDIKVIDGRIVKTEITKHYPPDTTAAIFWLKNRQKALWRDKVDVESNVKIKNLPAWLQPDTSEDSSDFPTTTP